MLGPGGQAYKGKKKHWTENWLHAGAKELCSLPFMQAIETDFNRITSLRRARASNGAFHSVFAGEKPVAQFNAPVIT